MQLRKHVLPNYKVQHSHSSENGKSRDHTRSPTTACRFTGLSYMCVRSCLLCRHNRRRPIASVHMIPHHLEFNTIIFNCAHGHGSNFLILLNCACTLLFTCSSIIQLKESIHIITTELHFYTID